MTPRTAKDAAWQLHLENERLRTFNSRLMRRLEVVRNENRNGHCGYCGALTAGALVCPAHTDLVELEP